MGSGEGSEQGDRPRRRQGRRQPGAARLAELRSARDRLDADQAERRRREDGALADYAATIERIELVLAARDQRLAELEQQQAAVREDAQTRLGEVLRERSAVLARLNELGRSADELAVLVGLPVKQVRMMLREHRTESTPGSAPGSATESEPVASAPATDSADGSGGSHDETSPVLSGDAGDNESGAEGRAEGGADDSRGAVTRDGLSGEGAPLVAAAPATGG